MNKKAKRIFSAALAVVLAASGLYLFLRPVSAEVVAATAGTAEIWFLEEGIISSTDDHQVFSTVSGKVLEVLVSEDQYVEAGAVIARIDPADYLSEIQIRKSTIQSYSAQSGAASYSLSLDSLEQQLAHSQEQLDTYTGLYQAGVVPKEVYDSYQQVYDQLDSQIATLKNQDQSASSSYRALASAEQNAIAILENNVADCTVVAPVSGYITSLPVANVTAVYPQGVLATIKNDKGLSVESYVATEDVVHISVGDPVELIQKTREDDLVYTGTVTAIAAWAEEQVSALGLAEHKVKVTIQPDTDVPTAGSGYSLDVKYFTYRADQTITLPTSAFYRYDGTDYVFVAENAPLGHTLSARAVAKGPSGSSQAVVLAGLTPGEIVVKNATASGIEAGAKISPAY